ncbi:hypothetical protein GLOTRDRAFT_112628 [Gloeophyllum trabeum ATCC 11539]|uniref:Uncharacterized protein n=1 Tax=Gloeophyllum trabeum (strain ATCC 11539 / FP-39264 / Madison 617) TaxID=670483 RepID=S7PST5_GLOTA|nr:uncharacterized protein GLOTRDRAFT_112628 [Gloeophyllum trabeum ATCC 11539]EPQ50876.1 hypothetical protein GLOTRDRAFT_112628 [Gloeophyllum trabeum ATCC 11539]
MQAKKYDPSVNPLFSPIMGTVPLPGEPTATPQMTATNLPPQPQGLGLYTYPVTSPSPAPSNASFSSSSSGHSNHSHHSHHSHRSYMSDGRGHAHGYGGNPNMTLSPLATPHVNIINTPPALASYYSPASVPHHTHAHPQHRPTHAHTHSKTYPAHAPLPHTAYADYVYPRPRT